MALCQTKFKNFLISRIIKLNNILTAYNYILTIKNLAFHIQNPFFTRQLSKSCICTCFSFLSDCTSLISPLMCLRKSVACCSSVKCPNPSSTKCQQCLGNLLEVFTASCSVLVTSISARATGSGNPKGPPVFSLQLY